MESFFCQKKKLYLNIVKETFFFFLKLELNTWTLQSILKSSSPCNSLVYRTGRHHEVFNLAELLAVMQFWILLAGCWGFTSTKRSPPAHPHSFVWGVGNFCLIWMSTVLLQDHEVGPKWFSAVLRSKKIRLLLFLMAVWHKRVDWNLALDDF